MRLAQWLHDKAKAQKAARLESIGAQCFARCYWTGHPKPFKNPAAVALGKLGASKGEKAKAAIAVVLYGLSMVLPA